MSQTILEEFVTLWVVVDPIGTVPVFIAVTKDYDASTKRRIAIRAVLVSAAVLVFFVIAGEIILKHNRQGILSMANSGPGTDGSQFFLTFVKTPWLDGKHTIFGKITEGMDTLKALEAAGSQRGTPREPLSIETARVTVK